MEPLTREPAGTLPWLVAIMSKLLGPQGCPWDREQTLESLRPFLLEECCEVLDALDQGDADHHCEELGDLLFQIVFQTELASFGIEQVIGAIGDKLIRRHPHVFGEIQVRDSDEVLRNWEQIKAAEREERGEQRRHTLAAVPRSLPALPRARELIRRAARTGFDWPDASAARAKIDEELREVDAAVAGGDREAAGRELGDLLLAIVGWARKLEIDPEQALRGSTTRFNGRFDALEDALAHSGRKPADCSLDELLGLWRHVKTATG